MKFLITYKHFSVLGCILLASLILGCENNFHPIKENDVFEYSMYGILDSSADTQWVRVMPVRNSLIRDSIPNEATVTLIHENTGKSEQLSDTLIKLPQNTFIWNFFTTTPLQPNHTYTVEATSKQGEITSATVTIPSDFSTPEIYFSERTGLCHVVVDPKVENLPVAEVTYFFRVDYRTSITEIQRFPISYINSMEKFSYGYEFSFNDLPQIAREYEVNEENIIDLKGEVLIISADTNWYGFADEGAEIPGLNSNVQNGLGIVSGIVSKRLPLKPNVEDQLDLTLCPPR